MPQLGEAWASATEFIIDRNANPPKMLALLGDGLDLDSRPVVGWSAGVKSAHSSHRAKGFGDFPGAQQGSQPANGGDRGGRFAVANEAMNSHCRHLSYLKCRIGKLSVTP